MRIKTLAEREREWRRLYPEAFQRKPNRSKHKVRKSRHHLRNKVNGGIDVTANILILKVEKHHEWHHLFRNSDPEYIINVLQRMIRMKEYSYNECGT